MLSVGTSWSTPGAVVLSTHPQPTARPGPVGPRAPTIAGDHVCTRQHWSPQERRCPGRRTTGESRGESGKRASTTASICRILSTIIVVLCVSLRPARIPLYLPLSQRTRRVFMPNADYVPPQKAKTVSRDCNASHVNRREGVGKRARGPRRDSCRASDMERWDCAQHIEYPRRFATSYRDPRKRVAGREGVIQSLRAIGKRLPQRSRPPSLRGNWRVYLPGFTQPV